LKLGILKSFLTLKKKFQIKTLSSS